MDIKERICANSGPDAALATVAVAVFVHPLASVTVTVYVVVDAGDTIIDGVVAPVLHRYPSAGEDVRMTLPPVQNVSGPPADIVGIAPALTEIIVVAEVLPQVL